MSNQPVTPRPNYAFEISLSVLNHLGRNLYRSFATVLGEAISNSWDAGAKNVYIYIDRPSSSLVIKDDGEGMTPDDFQNKFLKIGYSKRQDGSAASPSGRPYIGRKGIGKLALLSCADKVSVITKTKSTPYTGGVIDNQQLDDAITHDLTPDKYPLEVFDSTAFEGHTANHEQGTIIRFDNVKDGIRNTLENLKKITALYFRFSLIDDDFNIYINGEKVTIDCLQDLADATQFVWVINELNDPLLNKLREIFDSKNNEERSISTDSRVKGFIGSVKVPANLKILGTGEKVSVDLFVNGRLRERDLLKHIPSARVTESYLYGQIHFNSLDDEEDRFTSSRESVVANDPKFQELLGILGDDVLKVILKEWDKLRRERRDDGDPENTEDINKKERKSEELYNAVTEEYENIADEDPEQSAKIEDWVSEFADDAKFNFTSYAECFIAENLVRKYIREEPVTLSESTQSEATRMKVKEQSNKTAGNVNIDIRKTTDDATYLDMDFLARAVDIPGTTNSLVNDSKEYKPVRDGVMHTSRLTEEAKRKLTSTFDNIKARIKILISGS